LQFREAIDVYEQGPIINPQTGQPYQSTQWDGLQYIEAPQMRLWGRIDRIGTRLAQGIGDHAQSIVGDQLYVLDVELWHRGTDELARSAIQELGDSLSISRGPTSNSVIPLPASFYA
jgi:hypothetical protein